jgi:DNA-binding PadR family transcriptional regulator
MDTAKKPGTPTTITGKIEKYLMKYKKIAVGDAENFYEIRPDQLYRSIYELRKKGYPIKSTWTETDDGERYVIYSISSKWSKKSLKQ